jgi:hypothetical protein
MANAKQRDLFDAEERDTATLLAQVGTTGLRHNAGLLDEEWHKDLKGEKAVKIYREMSDNEPIIAATLFVVEMILRQAETRIEPADDSPLAKEIAEFVESCVDDILEDGGWNGVTGSVLSLLTYGWSWLEKVYKIRRGIDAPVPQLRSRYRDGRIGWRKLPIRSQDSLQNWMISDTGETLGWVQVAEPDFEERMLLRGKGLHFRLRAHKSSPEGYSMLRPLYSSYYFAKRLRMTEGVGIYRNLAGMPKMELPAAIMSPSATSAETAIRAAYEAMVKKIYFGEHAGLVVPSEKTPDGKDTGYKFSLVASSGRANSEADVAIKRYESRMAMALLTQFLLLGQDSVGSFALSSDQTDLFSFALHAILDVRDGEFSTNAIPELVKINGWPAELAPRMKHGDVETPDIGKLAGAITSAVSAGVITPDDELESWYRETIGAPQADNATARVEPEPAGEDVPGGIQQGFGF